MTAPDLTPSGPKPRRAVFNVSESALRLAYMDIYGPLRVRGCDGSYFHMVLVLAESRKIYSYSLPDLKDGTIRKFLDLFLSRVTKETDGLSLRALHTDKFSSSRTLLTLLAGAVTGSSSPLVRATKILLNGTFRLSTTLFVQ